jgi:O-antigen ligase
MPAANRFSFPVPMLAVLAIIIFVSILMPRSLAILPGLAGLCAFAFWPLFHHGERRPLPADILMTVSAVVALAALSSLWGFDAGDVLERTGKIALVLIPGALLAGTVRSRAYGGFSGLWWVLPVATIAGAVLLCIEYRFGFPVYRLLRDIPAGQHVGTYEMNRSTVALVLIAIPLIPLVYDRMKARGWPGGKAMAATLCYGLVFIPVLLSTGSQTAQIAFFAGIVTLAAFPVRRRAAWAFLAAILCVGILSAPFVSQALFAHIPQDAAAEKGLWRWLVQANVFPRLEIWDFVSRYALHSPWIGYGLEATRMVEDFDSKQIYQPGLTVLHPHNIVLQVWMEFGLAGALLACAGTVLLLRRIYALEDLLARRMALSVFAAVMSVGIMSYGLWQGWWLGLIMMVTALAGGIAEIMTTDEKIPRQDRGI